MSREIKFRAWNPDTQTLFEVQDMKLFVSGKTMLNGFASSYHDSWPLMQFTGLKDKNGKEIWEGDIVKDDFYTGYVVWNEEDGCWGFKYINAFGKAQVSILSMSINGPDKVIGNIYENPELLGSRHDG